MGPGNRPLDIEWLEDFVTLAESGSFSRAAEARAIAQPAFSRHIRALEEWVGADLVDRAAHPATLTAAGKRFLPLTEDVLAQLIAARIKARMAHDHSVASLRIAATNALSLSFFPGWLAHIEASLQLGPIEMMSESSLACEELMVQRNVQFMLCHGNEAIAGRLDEMEYPMQRIADDMLVPVSAPLPSGQPRHAADEPTETALLAYSEASTLGHILRARLKHVLHKDAPFQTVFTAHNAVLLKTLAVEGRGMTWLPRSLIEAELRSGTLVMAGEPAWQVPLEIKLYRQPVALSATAEALWQSVVAQQDAG